MKKVKIIISAILILCLAVCFAGCSANHDKSSLIEVTYTLIIKEGTAERYWIAGNDEYTIANDGSEDTKEDTISSGDNYIVLKGENFTGNLELAVQDAEE